MADHSHLRHGLFDRAMDEVYWPNPVARFAPLEDKTKLYDIACQVIGDVPLTYLEFGVYEGWSLQRIAARFTHPSARFCGFDSFQGLPENWAPESPRGHFAVENLPNIQDDRVSFVTGWFQNTLPGFLASTRIGSPILVHFDADLYSSTLFLLASLWSSIPDYFFIFDEFQPDEVVALRDFAASFPVAYEFIAATVDEYKRPQQILGRMRRTELVL